MKTSALRTTIAAGEHRERELWPGATGKGGGGEGPDVGLALTKATRREGVRKYETKWEVKRSNAGHLPVYASPQ